MGLVFGRQERALNYWGISTPGDLIPRRVGRSPGPYVSNDTALTHSAVWAAIRLRARLISTLPVDAYRYIDFADGRKQVEANLTPFVANQRAFGQFLYSSQVELDRSGNSVGIIWEKDRQGFPAVIELKATSGCSATIEGSKILQWRIDGTEYDPENIWHETQYTVSGFPLGLSPVAYAAFGLGSYKSIQEFAANWFQSGQGPRASLRNTNKKLNTKESAVVKEAWRASQSMGEPFVHGNDWEYSLIQAEQASSDWLEAMRLSNVEVARFFDVPADVIDAAVQGGPTVTYANIVQKNLQFLIMHLGPTIIQRERALTDLLPRPRFIRLNSDALLRMDPLTLAQMIRTKIDSRTLAPSEARAVDNREPFTEAQIKEFELLGLNKTATGALTGASDLPTPAGTQTEPSEPPPAAPAPNEGKNSNGG